MFNLFKSAPKSYEDLDGKSFQANYQAASNAELLDVRTASEFASGTIPGAMNLDVNSREFQKAINTLDKDKEYYVFCRSGNRSGMACQLLSEKGFRTYNLAGGIGAWPR
ncbi:rhodanese-like domain-containing protein [Telluribacter humicola]|uniref:rhodanese-like domain-containing protein n=1 Tax=Telluribacter humicola TaxID=1720261 RepID=UPI001A971EDF|nr:rhodanese-like domain-containing protein [Telluribacter humicola]